MEGLKSFHEHVRNLRPEAEKLIDAGFALNALFAEEEIRLKREDEASILMTVRSAVVEQLEELKRIEALADLGHSRVSAASYVAELVATAIVSRGNRASAVKDYMLRKATEKKEPFGLIMIRIGPKGLPADAKALSISQLARDSNQTEPETVRRLWENGYLLFSEEGFSSLIDTLVADVRRGKLRLPVSREKLADIAGFNKPKASIKIVPID